MTNKKVYTLNIKKFLTFVSIVVLIIAIIIVIISSKKKIEINEATNISKLNASKYSKEIVEEYSKGGIKEKFITDFNSIQKSVSVYLISNSTTESSHFSELVDQVNEILKSTNWEKLETDKPIFWNGTWNINSSGNLIFKFENKDIEPSWINDEDIQGLITKN